MVPAWCISPPISFRRRRSQTLTISSALPVASHLPPFGDAATALTHETCAGKMNCGLRWNATPEWVLEPAAASEGTRVTVPCNPYSSFSYEPATILKAVGSVLGFGSRRVFFDFDLSAFSGAADTSSAGFRTRADSALCFPLSANEGRLASAFGDGFAFRFGSGARRARFGLGAALAARDWRFRTNFGLVPDVEAAAAFAAGRGIEPMMSGSRNVPKFG